MRNFLKRIFIIGLSTLSLSACNGPFSDLSNYDLKEIYAKCDSKNLNPAGAQRCNNIQDECDKRKKESGFRC